MGNHMRKRLLGEDDEGERENKRIMTGGKTLSSSTSTTTTSASYDDCPVTFNHAIIDDDDSTDSGIDRLRKQLYHDLEPQGQRFFIPFLTTTDLLQLSASSKGLLRYRYYLSRVKIVSPCPVGEDEGDTIGEVPTFLTKQNDELQCLSFDDPSVLSALDILAIEGCGCKVKVLEVLSATAFGHWTHQMLSRVMTKGLIGVKELKVTTSSIPSVMFALALGACPDLTRLHILQDQQLLRQHAAALSDTIVKGKFPNLQELIIDPPFKSPSSFHRIVQALQGEKCPNLMCIKVHRCNLDPSCGQALGGVLVSGGCRQLRRLDLSYNRRLGDAGMVPIIAALRNGSCLDLTHLIIPNVGLGDTGATALGGALSSGFLPCLQWLDISGSDCGTGEGLTVMFQGLASCLCLDVRYLNLESVGMRGSDGLVLGRALRDGACPNLEVLSLVRNPLDGEAVASIIDGMQAGGYRNLKRLYLADTGKGRDTATALTRALSKGLKCPDLDGLVIESPLTTASSFIPIAEALLTTSHPCLTKIHLSDCGLDSGCGKALGHALLSGSCIQLRHLDISHNSGLQDEGLLSIMKGLQAGCCPVLKSLTLADVGMGEAAATALGNVIVSGLLPYLTWLDIHESQCGKGLTRILQGLEQGCCPQLCHLDLESTMMDLEHALLLGEILEAGRCPEISNVKLANNDLGGIGVASIINSLEKAERCPKLNQMSLAMTTNTLCLVRSNPEKYYCALRLMGDSGLLCHGLQELVIKGHLTSHSVFEGLAKTLEEGACPDMTTLTLSACGLCSAFGRALGRAMRSGNLKRLKKLDLSHNGSLGSEGIQPIMEALQAGSCPDLTHLVIEGVGMRDTGFMALGHALSSGSIPHLQWLDLQGSPHKSCRGAGQGLVEVLHGLFSGHCHELRHLNLKSTVIKAEHTRVLNEALRAGTCPKLEELNLGINPLGDSGVSSVIESVEKGRCPKLKRLYLASTGMGPEGSNALVRSLVSGVTYPDLHELIIKSPLAVPGAFTPIAATIQAGVYSDLTRIKLSNCDVDGRALGDALRSGHCTKLKSLELRHCTGLQEDEGIVHIIEGLQGRTCPELTYLVFEDVGMGEAAATALGNIMWSGCLAKLHLLDINGCDGGIGLIHIMQGIKGGGCPDLRDLNLESTVMDFEDGRLLGEALGAGTCPKLEVLRLANNDLRDCGVGYLLDGLEAGGCPVIQRLYLANTGLGPTGICRLARVLSTGLLIDERCTVLTCPDLHELIIESSFDSPSSDFNLITEAIFVGAWPSPTTIKLSSCGLDDPVCGVALRNVLSSDRCAQLQSLEIRHNSGLGDQGILRIIEALQAETWPHLTRITLVDVGMGEAAATALGDVIISGSLPNLQWLDIQGAQCGTGLTRILQGIRREGCPQLRNLNLESTMMNVEHGRLLGDTLRSGSCPKLEELRIANNSQLGATGVGYVIDGVKGRGCPELKRLYLANTGIGPEGAEALRSTSSSSSLSSLQLLHR